MYHALLTHPHVSELQVELPLGPVRPDISFRWNDEVMIAVELQRSTLPPVDVASRTSHYEEKGIAVLWVALPRDRFSAGTRSSTRIWERYLHELYGGKIFCWYGGQVLLATRLDPYVLRSEYRERYDRRTRTWEAKEIQHFSKRSRIPHHLDTVRLTDLRVVAVFPRQRGPFALPKAKLWSLEIPQKEVER
jgi:Competence protein CoiA-like family